MSVLAQRRKRPCWPQFTLASMLVMVTAAAVHFACWLAQFASLERQRHVGEELKEFGPHAHWGSDGVWLLEFQPESKILDAQQLAKLEALPVLWAIDLRDARVTDRGLRTVAALPRMRWIMLPDNGIQDRTSQELEQQYPDVNFVRLSGRVARSEPEKPSE